MKKISLMESKKFAKKEFNTDEDDDADDDDNKKYHKFRDHCHYTEKFRGAAHNICNLRYITPKEVTVVLHNGSTYEIHFIINQLAKEFKEKLECLGENAEKYITFSVPIKKRLNIGKTISYKLNFVDSFRFVSTSLSSLVDNLSEKLHSHECKDCKSEVDYMSFKDDQLIFRCFEYNSVECKKILKNILIKI